MQRNYLNEHVIKFNVENRNRVKKRIKFIDEMPKIVQIKNMSKKQGTIISIQCCYQTVHGLRSKLREINVLRI